MSDSIPEHLINSEAADDMVRQLPSWMPKDPDSSNADVMSVIGAAIDRIDENIDAVDRASKLSTSETIDQIDKHARLVDLVSNFEETEEHYRIRTEARYKLNTSRGTASDIILTTADLLGVDPTEIGYNEDIQNGLVILEFPSAAIDNLDLDISSFLEILNTNTAAGFRVEATIRGTFTYLSEDAEAADEHDPELGYDGLDENGEPTGTGGTYAGELN